MRRNGFSLIELLLSLAILATVILFVLGLFMGILSSSQKSADLSAGTVVAEGALNRELYGILNDDTTRENFFTGVMSGAYLPSAAPVRSGTTTSLNGATFNYALYATPLDPGLSAPDRAAKVDVLVWWSALPGQARRGSGQQRVSLSRVLSESTRVP